MPHMDRVLQSEMRRKRGQVICVMIHIVPSGNLRRASMPTAVVRNHSIPFAQKKQHLVIPVSSRKRPTMSEHNWLPRTPVLVKILNAVCGCDGGHKDSLDNWI